MNIANCVTRNVTQNDNASLPMVQEGRSNASPAQQQPNSVATDRLTLLRERSEDSAREVERLDRLLRRQAARRNRLNKAIAGTRRRLLRATEMAGETRRALEAASGGAA